MAKLKTRNARALSASFVTEAGSENQVMSVTSADAAQYSMSPVSGKTPHGDNIARSDAIAYPIPQRRTKKMSKYRSSSCSTIFEGENMSLQQPVKAGDAQPHVYKRPVGEQRSNPELSRRTRPPRPPPPAKPIPPRTFLDTASADKTRMAGKRSKSGQQAGQVAIVIDTRGRRRHSDTVQPIRPPLPYETFVRQKESHKSGSSCSSDADSDLSAVDGEQPGADKMAPADYEVVVPVGARLSVSPSGNRTVNFPSRKLQPRPVGGNEVTTGNEEEHLYSTISEERMASPYSVPNDHNEVFRESDSLVKALAKCEVSNSKPNASQQGCKKQESNSKKDFSLKTDVEGDERHSLSSEEGVDCEPLYIEMNPTVYIAPPKDYKPKRRFKERHK